MSGLHPVMGQALAAVIPPRAAAPAHNCPVCKDTGNRAGLVFGYMDCTSCDVPQERERFNAWLVEQDFRPRVQEDMAWEIYRHGMQQVQA